MVLMLFINFSSSFSISITPTPAWTHFNLLGVNNFQPLAIISHFLDLLQRCLFPVSSYKTELLLDFPFRYWMAQTLWSSSWGWMMNLRELAIAIVRALYNPWFTTKIGRSAWRLEENKCRPIFKKEDPGDYRPVRLNLIPGKVME